LANQSKATAKEKTALSILVSELDRCTELGADWRKQNYPASINGYGNTYQSFLRSAMAELYAGKLTFGDFAKARDRELTELLNKVSQEVQQIQAQRAGEKRQQEQAANAAEEQRRAAVRRSFEQAEAQRRYEEQQAMQADESRRQAALQYLFNQRQAQPYQVQPYQMPVPKTTNCSTYGNQTNCTTR
jgi:flagellar biosynthesis GTPase FlhF